MGKFLLTDLVALFPADEASTATDDGLIISSSDRVDKERWLRSSRSYPGVILRPLIVTPSESARPSFSVQFRSNRTTAALMHGHYEVEITTTEFDHVALCDSLYAALALLEVSIEDWLAFIPVREHELPDNRTISVDKAMSWHDCSFNELVDPPLSDLAFSHRVQYDYETDDAMWRIATAIASDAEIVYALFFLREAFRDYQFHWDDGERVLRNPQVLPISTSSATRIENAVHNCYKSIEAISGGNLPKKQTKVMKKFREIGVDLEQKVGFETSFTKQEPAIDKLMRLRFCRDWKSAHGRIQRDRKSSFFELMDFQQLTRYILKDALKARVGITAFGKDVGE